MAETNQAKSFAEQEQACTAASVVRFLRQPSTYAEEVQLVEMRETHISWVFLTTTCAYKLKKPVKFEFLDFSTAPLRRQACDDELRLNRRLAADVYLEVVPVTRDESGRLALGGRGEPIDWLVQMRRLPDQRSLAALIAAGKVTKDNLRKIADLLTRFYREAPPAPLAPEAYRQAVDHHLRANREALLATSGQLAEFQVKRIHTALLRFLHTRREAFDDRVRQGRIVDGHGDLRPEHVYLTDPPVVIDCCEFNEEFRQIDVLDELCFLAMECAHADARWIGEQIIEHYLQTSDDRLTSQLRAFYTSYRAGVRAKVNVLRANQLPQMEHDQAMRMASRYLELADEFSRELGPPTVLIVRGPAGVGKTTLAVALADLLGMEHLQTDAVRRELFHSAGRRVGHNEGLYTPESRRQVYEAMYQQAQTLIAEGVSVVLDGTFLTNELQLQAVNVARERGAQALLVNCSCDPETAADRISRRELAGGSFSEAQAVTHAKQLEEQQSPSPALPQCEVDTGHAVPTIVRTVLAALRLPE